MIDRDAFTAIFAHLTIAFGEELSDERLLIYFDALADLTPGKLAYAARAAVRICRFFPKVAELRALAADAPEEKPVQRRLSFARPNGKVSGMAREVATILTLPMPVRLSKLRELAALYPGVGWEDAVAEAEREHTRRAS